jgi:molecular chaperone DnaJ
VNVWTPQNLTPEEKAQLEKMNSSPNFKPQPEKSDKRFFDKVREMFS